MRSIALICSLFAILLIGSALECNLCIGSDKSDCYKHDNASMVTQLCVIPTLLQHHRLHTKTSPSIVDSLFSTKQENITSEFLNNSTSDEADNKTIIDTYCVYLIEKANQTVVTRGCGYIYHNVDICKYIKEKNKFVEVCKACSENNCN